MLPEPAEKKINSEGWEEEMGIVFFRGSLWVASSRYVQVQADTPSFRPVLHPF